LALIVMGSTATQAQDFTATATQPEDHPTRRAIAQMDRLVRDRTQGRHSINVHLAVPGSPFSRATQSR
jgi:TRAP-type C4-dicarboxylate transport system substrate-binding protein